MTSGIRHCISACATLLLILSPGLAQPGSSAEHTTPVTSRNMAGLQQAFDRHPPAFIENRGQWGSQARFLLRSSGLDVWVTDHGVVYDLRRIEQSADAGCSTTTTADGPASPASVKYTAVRMNFTGTYPDARAHGNERADGYHNYFIGNDPSKWATHVPLYYSARIDNLYAGIDAIFYLDVERPRYDLVLAPGADVSQVKMRFEGAETVSIDESGSLVIGTSLGTLRQRELYAYQMRDGVRRQVRCAFRQGKDGIVSFDVGSYDRLRPLVIDPVVVIYSTYLAGSRSDIVGGFADDTGWGVAADTGGNAYIVGSTSSADFPVLKASQPTKATDGSGQSDAFVTKLTASGALAYSTYLGGSSIDAGWGIAVDGSGAAYITGGTASFDFPTLNPVQSSNAGGGGFGDAFVTKLTGSGALAYSTYLGGSGDDVGYGIAVDGGNAHVTGYTNSLNFPVLKPMQLSKGAGMGSQDAFVTKLTAAGALAYSTYLGASSVDEGHGIAVDTDGNAYVTGATGSTDFPTFNPVQPSKAGNTNAFVTKLTAAGTLSYSTYLGGSGSDDGRGIAVDGSGNAYVAGTTSSTDFPTLNAYASQSSSPGVNDAFVTKLTAAGAISYSTYLGGSSGDEGMSVAVDAGGIACVTGFTQSMNFPTLSPTQPSYAEGSDAFVTRLTASGAISFSTFLGGSGGEFGHGIAVDGRGSAFVTGGTISQDFPTKNPAQSTPGVDGDVFVTRFSFDSDIMSTDFGAQSYTRSEPDGLRLYAVAPQPARDHLAVRFALRNAARITLEIHAVDGTLAGVAIRNRSFEPGEYREVLEIGALMPGSYVLRLIADGRVGVERFVVVR